MFPAREARAWSMVPRRKSPTGTSTLSPGSGNDRPPLDRTGLGYGALASREDRSVSRPDEHGPSRQSNRDDTRDPACEARSGPPAAKIKRSPTETRWWREPASNHRSRRKRDGRQERPAVDHRRLARRPVINDPSSLSVRHLSSATAERPFTKSGTDGSNLVPSRASKGKPRGGRWGCPMSSSTASFTNGQIPAMPLSSCCADRPIGRRRAIAFGDPRSNQTRRTDRSAAGGPDEAQRLTVVDKGADGQTSVRQLIPVRFNRLETVV